VLNVGRSVLGVNIQARFKSLRFHCDTEGQCHTLQEQTSFHEIWIPISHAKYCKVKLNFGIYKLVHIKCFVMFLEAHPLQIFSEVFYWLWLAQASSELGLIYWLLLAQ